MKYYLSVLAIFKNEKHIMKEWLLHHMKEGVEHFYLIDNDSDSSYDCTDILNEFGGNKITKFNLPNKHEQANIYRYIVTNYIVPTNETEWLMIIDLDEFMYATSLNSTVVQEIRKLEQETPDIGAVRIVWKMFGSNGHIQQPRSVVKHFTKRKNYTVPIKEEIKNIIKPRLTYGFGIHEIQLYPPYIRVPETHDFSHGLQCEEMITESKIQLNHYVTQSLEFYENVKMTRGAADVQVNYRTLELFHNYQTILNDTFDDSLYQKHRELYDSIDNDEQF